MTHLPPPPPPSSLVWWKISSFCTLVHDSSTYGKVALDSFIFKTKKKQKHTRAHSEILIYLELLHWFSHVLWIRVQLLSHFLLVKGINGEKRTWHRLVVCRHHTIALTLLCWIELDEGVERGGRGGEEIFSISHPSPWPIWGGGECPHLQVVPYTCNCG